MIVLHESDEPRTFKESLTSPAKKQWVKSMEDEMESMKTNDVWDLVDLPSDCRAIGNKWVVHIKHEADGTIERSRLVAKGYTQQEGVDYEETFSPIVKLVSI